MSTLLYNPDKKNKQQFIEEFVVRTSAFEELFKDIQTGKMKYPEQHYLILGQRGSGKTTLLNRLKYAIEDDAKLKWLIPILFNEEQYHISELGNVWENIATYLEDFHGFEGLTEDMNQYLSKKDFEQLALDILVKNLDKQGKKIVLFVDNIGDLLKKFDELEVRRLREILQTIPHIRLIAGSPVMLESILDYQQPLFEFFKVIQLKGLTYEETILLLKKLAELNHQTKKIDTIIENTPSRIETLRTLSGGVPRTIALLFMVFIDDEHGNAVSDLEKVLDLVTPLYKHRMDDLPTQQQKIVDAVAKNWDAVSVKELSETLRIESKIISAQLRQLEKNQVIEKRTTDTKNHIYLLRERFFNIWYLMRYGRKQDRQRVVWLVKFLEMWCDEKEIEKRILNFADKSKKGLLDDKTHEFYSEVYSFFEKTSTETRILFREAASEYVAKYIQLTDEEFNKMIDKHYEKRKWNDIVKSYIQRDSFTDIIKTKMLELVIQDKESNIIKLIQKNFSSYSDDHDEYNPPFFYSLYMYYFFVTVPINLTDPEILNSNSKAVKILIRKLIENNRFMLFEIQNLSLYITRLVCTQNNNLALSFFNENEMLKEELKTHYILTLYFANNKSPEILSRYGSELVESVVRLSKQVFEIQTRLFNK